MAANLDYLDPTLIPLGEKANAYLETEKALRHLTQTNLPATGTAENPEQLRQQLARLENEIIALLPTRNEWVKVNLGYGPSRIGAWLVPAIGNAPVRYELRVIH